MITVSGFTTEDRLDIIQSEINALSGRCATARDDIMSIRHDIDYGIYDGLRAVSDPDRIKCIVLDLLKELGIIDDNCVYRNCGGIQISEESFMKFVEGKTNDYT